MTVKELIQRLQECPEDAEVLYLHNIYSRIHIDTIEVKEENILAGEKVYTVTFSGKYEGD